MKVLVVAPYWPPGGGGLERYARETATRLAARGHTVRVLAFGPRGRAYQDGGMDVELLRAPLRISNTPIDLRLPGAIRRAARALGPDVVLAHGPVPFPLEMAALVTPAAAAFVPVIHAGALRGPSRLLDAVAALDRRTLLARALSRADRIVAVSRFVRDGLLRAHAGKTAVIPPGVDLERFSVGPPPDARRVAFVGPVDAAYTWKGFDTLWEAAARSGVGLDVVGGGDRVPGFARRAAREGVDARFLGRLSEADLVTTLHGVGAVVLPSTSPAESFGMALAEANACGRPGVGTRMGGIPEVIEHGENGLLVPPGDPDALARALRRLAEDPLAAAQMGRRGRHRIERHHNWAALTRRLESVLEEASGPHVAARRQEPVAQRPEAGGGRDAEGAEEGAGPPQVG